MIEGASIDEAQYVTGTALSAWHMLLRAHYLISRELDTDLIEHHGLTMSDYDVLVQLRECCEHRVRMSDLASQSRLTRSGMTRLIEGLERDGLVTRKRCTNDQRVSFAVLTERGEQMLKDARGTHHRGIQRAFADHFVEAEFEQLRELLIRVPGGCLGSLDPALQGRAAEPTDDPCADDASATVT